MKVIVKTINNDYDVSHKVNVDGTNTWNIYPLYECPEDAIIGRDLIDGYHLLEAIQMGYDAAKRGEELIIEEIEETEE